MVMEAPPSPQSVGREFVRQYYTLLNKAPTHLHRFYNHQSSFVHGGLDPPNRETSPVIGQKQIHQKIQQLNFRDCHAKITQVDSQATLGNGVVVQVTGELSNAGQPMRRFTQTFVLAAQSPKKYYVHNDIFRYQDEIVSDEDCEPEVGSETEEEVSAGSSSSSEDEEIVLRRPRIYRRRERRFLNLDDLEFFNRFRLTKSTVLSLLQQIAHSLHVPTNRNGRVDPMNQLLLTLRYYATGHIILTTGAFVGISKIAASRIVVRVSKAIATLRPQHLKMYQSDEERRGVAEKFCALASFPRVIGAIGCTLVKIHYPSGDLGRNIAENFLCRHNYFAFNVQTVSDTDLRMSNIVARWPGLASDQTVFDNSTLKKQFESGEFGQYCLVGNSGYSPQPYLMTKLPKAHTTAENSYNDSITRTQNVVERSFVVWKRRFPILTIGIRAQIETVMALIVATAVLHNISIDMKEGFPNAWLDEVKQEDDSPAGIITPIQATTQVMVEVQPPINQPAVQPYYNPNAGQIQPIPAVPIHHNQQPPPHVMTAQPVVPTVNGAIHPDDINVMQGQVPAHIPAAQPQGLGTPMPTLQPTMIQAPLNPPAPIEDLQTEVIEEPIEEPLESAYVIEQQELEPEQDMGMMDSASNEPKTYANLLKSGGAVPFSSPPSQVPSAPVAIVQPAAARSVSPPSSGGYQSVGGRGNNNGNMNNRGGARVNQQQPRMQNRQDSGRASMGGGGRNSFNEEAPYEDRRRSQNQSFNDVNQLFLGNLPHTATEDELRDIFSDFGVIVDLRVHSKPPNKIGGAPGGRAPPNYGFITYDTQQGVQNCLQAKPIFYPKDDKNGTPLNVEEKKTKERGERPPYGGGRPMDNRGRGDNGGPRRGMGGPGGPNRNSSGGPGGPPGPNNRTNTYNSRNSGGPPSRGSNTYNRR